MYFLKKVGTRTFFMLGDEPGWDLIFSPDLFPATARDAGLAVTYLYCKILQNIAHSHDLTTPLQHFYDLTKEILNWAESDKIELVYKSHG